MRHQLSITISVVAFCCAYNANVSHAEVKVNHKGLETSLISPNIRLNVGGRFHYDAVRTKTDIASNNEEVRRARIDATISVGDNVRFKVDREFSSGREGWRNVWGQYRKGDWRIKVGQFVTPFSTEELSESNNLAFTERALTSALSPGFRLGVSTTLRGDQWSATGAIMGDPINNPSSFDDGISFVGRGVYNPIRTRKNVVHLAAAVEYRDLNGDATTRVQSGHEVSLRENRLLRGERILYAQSYLNGNLEAGFKTNRFLVLSQGIIRQTNTRDETPTSYGGYLQASYLFGPAKRKYSRTTGSFGAVIPEERWGVVEGSARVSRLTIKDTTGRVGNETAATVGLAWHVTQNLRVTASTTYTDIENLRRQRDYSGFVHQARLQVAF